jgi:hypothetical protein
MSQQELRREVAMGLSVESEKQLDFQTLWFKKGR